MLLRAIQKQELYLLSDPKNQRRYMGDQIFEPLYMDRQNIPDFFTQIENFKEAIYQKSNLHYSRGITAKRVTSGRAHLRGYLVRRQHCSESQR